MADNTVKIKFEIDGVEYSIDQLQELGKAAKKTGDEVKDSNDKVKESSKEAEKEVGFLGERFKSLQEDVTNFGKKAKGDFMNAFNGLQKLGQGFGLGAKGAKAFAVSLSALGIPLILAALTALVEYFKNFEAGVKVITKVTNVFNAVLGQLGSIVEGIINLDWGKISDGFTGIAGAASDAADNTDKLFDANKKLADLNKTQVVENAKLRNELELQQKILEDGTKSYEEKEAAIQKIGIAEQQLLANAIAITKAEEQRLKASIALENNFEARRQLEQELAEVQAGLIEQQGDLERTRFEVDKKVRELDQERLDKARELAEKELQLRRDFEAQLLSFEQQIELSSIKNLEDRERRKLEIERDNQILSVQQSEQSEERKQILIGKIQEVYQLAELERIDGLNKTKEEKEKAYLQRLGAIRNEIELLNAEDERERAILSLAQQEQAALAEIENTEENQALILAIKEKYRILNRQQEEQFRVEDQEKEFALIEQEAALAFARFEALGNISNAARKRELANAQAYFDQLLADETLTADQRTAIEQQRADTVFNINENIKAAQAASLDAVQGTFQALGSIFKEGSAAAKAFAVADAIINTYKAANLALASAPPPFGAILAAANVAAGIVNVKKILSTNPGTTNATAAGSVPTGQSSVVSAARGIPDISQVFSAANAASPINAQAVQGRLAGPATQAPVKAFVISGEVSSAQEADSKIQKLARL